MLLPYEILQMIFEQACANKASPYTLTLTCREWYRIASATLTLWSRICFGDRSCRFTEGDKVGCSSLASLSAALIRIGDVPFELTIDCRRKEIDSEELELFKAYNGIECLSRCRSLIWLNLSSLSGWYPFIQFLSVAQYSALEVLGSRGRHAGILQELSALLSQIQDTAPLLQSLTFDGSWYGRSLELHLYPQLLRRVKYLQIPMWIDSIWPKLESLEELELIVNQDWGKALLPNCNRLHKVVLTGTRGLQVFEQNILNNLVDITIQSAQPWWCLHPSGVSEISLPSLIRLEVIGTLFAVPPITAPKLDMLMVIVSMIGSTYFRQKLSPPVQVKFRPRLLRIDKPHGDRELLKVLENIWDGLQELQITILRSTDILGGIFTKAICGPTVPIFPHLRALTVLLPFSNGYKSLQTTIVNLQRIKKALKSRGELSSLWCGWCSVHPPTPERFWQFWKARKYHDLEARKDWIITWQSLL